MKARLRLAHLLALLERLPIRQLWLGSVAASLALSEVVAMAMEWLLLGRVTADYLATAAVASVLVASAVTAVILHSAGQTRRFAAFLAESEERYRIISNLSSDFFFCCVRSGSECFRIEWLAGSCKQLFGIGPEEMTARGCWRSAVVDDDLATFDHHIDALPPGEASECELRVRHVDGSIRYLRVHARSLPKPAHGGLQRLYGSCRDVTERKRIEADLQIAATAFESQVGIMVTDASGVILKVNRAFTEGTGYSAEEAVGRTPRLLKSGRHDAAFYAEMWQSILGAGLWQGEVWDRRKNGEVYPQWLTVSAVKGANGAIGHYVGTQIDITSLKAAEEQVRHLAFYDPLTHLPNRRLLYDRLGHSLAASNRSLRQGALLFIDLDQFKTLNDTLGHVHGDLLLQQVAERLARCVRQGDTVARLGGDEFVVVLEDLGPKAGEAAALAETVGEKILAEFDRGFVLSGQEHQGTASIGVTLFGSGGETTDELLKQADLAMYQAKAAGRNTLRFFDPKMQAAVTARVDLEKDLRDALREEQFVLYFQPQVDDAARITGAEALVRWQHPQRGLVFPAEFIPLAEETRLIIPLGQWVLESACARLAAWADRDDAGQLTLAVNVSAQQLRQPDFVERVLAVLDNTGADPRKLKLELTESILLVEVEDTIAKMTALKNRGVGFALDDFGTGYSSLSYLKRLPLEKLKIDQSFVIDVLTDPNDAAIAKTIVALAQSLGLAVIAEGVETEEQRDFLARNGCRAYQGYLFGRPLPLREFERLLRRSGAAAAEIQDPASHAA